MVLLLLIRRTTIQECTKRLVLGCVNEYMEIICVVCRRMCRSNMTTCIENPRTSLLVRSGNSFNELCASYLSNKFRPCWFSTLSAVDIDPSESIGRGGTPESSLLPPFGSL